MVSVSGLPRRKAASPESPPAPGVSPRFWAKRFLPIMGLVVGRTDHGGRLSNQTMSDQTLTLTADAPTSGNLKKIKQLKRAAAALGMSIRYDGTQLDDKWKAWHASIGRGIFENGEQVASKVC